MSQLQGFGATVYAAAQTSLAFTSEPMTDAGDHKTYTITNSAKRYWDRAVAVTVLQSINSGTTYTTITTGFTIQPCGGRVIFAVANNATYLYQVSGSYLPVTAIANGHDWTLTTSLTLATADVFGSAWAQSVPIIGDAIANIAQYWTDNYFYNQLVANQVIILALYVSSASGARYEGFAWINKEQLKTPEMALVDATYDFMIDGTLYYNPGP